jgi:hypothetical protein
MKKSMLCTLILSSILFLLTACNDKTNTAIANTSSSASMAATPVITDAWLGKWHGPEGTFLEISGGNGNYEIIIQDLDGPKQYRGTSNGDHISFERNGATETIQASNGADTGMKWLAGKSNCLRVGLGEGWCRD